MIKFDSVTKQFGNITALNNISFSVDSGEFVYLMGPSGAGKTTIARLLIKEYEPTGGDIAVGEYKLSDIKSKEIPKYRQQIGVVFQDFQLLPERTASENIALALEITNKTDATIQKTVEELLKVIGLADRGDLFPRQLSGGEIQRVVIARALATEPPVLFADEPTGNLDIDTSWQIVELLESINKQGTTVIMSTHNHEIVNKLKKRTIFLENGTIKKDTAGKKHESKEHHKDKKEDEEVVENKQEQKEEKVDA